MVVHRSTNEMTGAAALPPLYPITQYDHAGYVLVVTYTLLILMILLVAARVSTRWYVVKFMRCDDAFLMAACLLGTTQSILIQLAVNHGLGKTRSTVSHSDFMLFQKYEYSAQMVLIAAMAAAKVSLVLLIHSLIAEGKSLWASRGLVVIITTWAAASVFALAFQCSLPVPWDIRHGSCINLPALHTAVAAVNIATDALLILLPCLVFWKVHDKLRRFRVVSLFASRIIVCIFAGVQLRYFNRSLHSPDPTWVAMDPNIWDQFMMHFSIICTAIPSLGRLIVELQPEVNAFAITERHGLRNSDKYALSAFDHGLANYLKTKPGPGNIVNRIRNQNPDAESLQGLGEDVLKQNKRLIKQTIDSETQYLSEHSE